MHFVSCIYSFLSGLQEFQQKKEPRFFLGSLIPFVRRPHTPRDRDVREIYRIAGIQLPGAVVMDFVLQAFEK